MFLTVYLDEAVENEKLFVEVCIRLKLTLNGKILVHGQKDRLKHARNDAR